MCYTIEKNLTREQLEKRFGSKLNTERPYSPGKRVSGFEFPDVPVLIPKSDKIEILTWGLIPVWTCDIENAKQIRTKTLNAKAETLLEKPSFRNLLKGNRCLVLTNGYYEWQHINKNKIAHFISLKDDIAMPLAGLYDKWIDIQTGEIYNTFTIITTCANKMMERIHNTKKRMPVILNKSNERNWINPKLSENDAIDMLKPFNQELMTAVRLDDHKHDSFQQSLFE